MSRNIAVGFEASADFQIATDLADRVLCESIEWLDEHLIPHQRDWLSCSPEGHLLTWTNIDESARNANIRAHGHFDGEPAEPDAIAARRVIRYLRNVFDELDAILLIRDQDHEPETRRGLEQARNENHAGIPIVVGLAIVERESWVISGFDPRDDVEIERLEAERKNLGFPPAFRSHEFTACKNDQAKRNPKRVLRELIAGDPDRERHCWRETPLTFLHERGAENGLKDFLDEIKVRLGPLFGHAR